MATFKPVKNGWQAQVARRVNGKPFRKAKTFKTKRQAQFWAREVEAEIDKGKAEESQDTMATVFDRYAMERSRGKKGERWEVIRLKRFARDLVNDTPLGEFKIGEITTPDLAAWRDARLQEVQPSSVKREMNLLKHVFVTATEDWGLITINPMAKVKRPTGIKRRTRRVYPDEIEKITAALDLETEPWTSPRQITGATFLFAIETSMRSGEILRMKNRDIENQVVVLPETKNEHEREVPIADVAFAILNKVRNGNLDPDAHPFFLHEEMDQADSIRDSTFRAAVRRAGIVNLHFHDTRHEAITRLAKRLGPMNLARMTGHRNLNELMTYYEASGEDLLEILNASTSSDEIK